MDYGFIETNRLRKNSYIDKNLTDEDLSTSIMIAQETMLQPVIGTVLYDFIIEGIKNDNLPDKYVDLLENKIEDVLTYYTIYKLINTKMYVICNSGITKDEKSISIEELRYLRSEIKSTYIGYERVLLMYLNAHTTDYPEFSQTIDGGDISNKEEETMTFFDMSTLREQYNGF